MTLFPIYQKKKKTFFQIRDQNKKSGPSNTKFSSVNLIDQSELHQINGKDLILGLGSYGRCILKTFSRLKIQVVEKQFLVHNTKEMVKEAQIMQALTHKNIPAIIGIQVEKEPISLVMEFKGEENTSMTVSKLLSCEEGNETVHKVKSSLTTKDWLIIAHDLTDALAHIHSKGFLHCDLKSNNVLVAENHGHIIDFGKACDSAFPPAKKYTLHYRHIAPEVLNGAPCSKASDIYSLGKILHEVAIKQEIPVLLVNAQKCLDHNPAGRPTTTGLMASLASVICNC